MGAYQVTQGDKTMNNNSAEETFDVNNLGGLLAGVLLGGLAGAAAMLLLAPQSGKKTRKQIRRKGEDLRHLTAESIEDSMNQMRTKAHQLSTSIHEQAEGLQQHGQDVIDQQKERWIPVVDAGKTAVNGS
jgi:gas vesicle protein